MATTLTATEREERAAALHATIAAQIDALRTSEGWAAYLAFARSFRDYSLNNTLLILAQRPTATRVAGFRKWQELGRQVRKGETGIKVFGFSQRPCKRNACPHTEEDPEHKHITYPILTVFDLAQTDPIEGAPPIPEYVIGTNDGADLAATLTANLETLGYTITHATTGRAKGYTEPGKKITISHGLAAADELEVLLHETAHNILGHVDDLTTNEYRTHRGLCEVEAESAAYVAAGLLGIDTAPASIAYLAGWSTAQPELITTTARRVITAAAALADLVTNNTPPQHQPSPLAP